MKMSENKRQALYDAIFEQTKQLRVKLKNEHELPNTVDYEIAAIARPIYNDVKRVLNVKDD